MTAVTIEPGRFQCPVCPERFIVLGDKKAHMRETHPKPVSKG